MKHSAILSNKRRAAPCSYYVVDVYCPACRHTITVGFNGWRSLMCRCGVELERTPYRKPTTAPTACARGDYQRELLTGAARWSGGDLRGKQKRYSARYYQSRKTLTHRLRMAGHVVTVETIDRVVVLHVDGVPCSRA